MPLNPPALASGFITPQLIASGNIGNGVSKLSMGIAIGVVQFLSQATVTTTDVGTLGVGATVFPLIVPSPLVQAELIKGVTSLQIFGQLAPAFCQGLSLGLTTGWQALALYNIQHPGVGTGTAVAKLVAPSAVPSMLFGFSSASMTGTGPFKMARAIGTALDTTFAQFIQAGLPIVGSVSPVGGSGVGIGKII